MTAVCTSYINLEFPPWNGYAYTTANLLKSKIPFLLEETVFPFTAVEHQGLTNAYHTYSGKTPAWVNTTWISQGRLVWCVFPGKIRFQVVLQSIDQLLYESTLEAQLQLQQDWLSDAIPRSLLKHNCKFLLFSHWSLAFRTESKWLAWICSGKFSQEWWDRGPAFLYSVLKNFWAYMLFFFQRSSIMT